MTFLGVWILGIIVLGAFLAFKAGRDDYDVDNDTEVWAMLIALWPFVLTFTLIFLPFVGIYKLGKKARPK